MLMVEMQQLVGNLPALTRVSHSASESISNVVLTRVVDKIVGHTTGRPICNPVSLAFRLAVVAFKPAQARLNLMVSELSQRDCLPQCQVDFLYGASSSSTVTKSSIG